MTCVSIPLLVNATAVQIIEEVITIVEGEQEIQHVKKIKDIKGNIIARWGGTCGRWDTHS